MDIKGKILSQDDIIVKLEIEMTIGQLRSIIDDIDHVRLHRPSGIFLSKLKSLSREVNQIFWTKEEDEE